MKQYYKYILITAITALAAACAVPQSKIAKPAIPAVFRGDTFAALADSQQLAAIPWRAFINDDDLASLIDTALQYNRDLQLAIKNIEIADQLNRKAKQVLLPTIGVGVSSSNSLPSKNSLNGITADQVLDSRSLNNYMVSANVSWELNVWGKIRNTRAEGLAEYLRTQDARKAVQTSLIANVAAGYYDLLMLDQQIGIARKNLLLRDSSLRIINIQYSSAQVSSLAVQQEEALRLEAAQLIPKLEQQIALRENALSVLAGVAPQTIKRGGALYDRKLPVITGVGLPVEMLAVRPDVKADEQAVNAASARIGIAHANMYPSLNIGASGGLNSLKTSNWFNMPASLFGVVTGSIAQPLLQKRELRTQYEVAKLQREQVVIHFRQTVLNAYQEVSDALISVEKLEEQQLIAGQRVLQLQEATHNADLLFSNGMATYLEVITAQRNLLTTELEQASIRRDELNAAIALYRSLGGGWK